MQTIHLHNSLSKKKERFVPIDKNHIGFYACGPTVYDYAHIGNFRSFLTSDVLFRVLQLAGYNVTKVQNITDVGHLTNDDDADSSGEDKIAKKAQKEQKDAFEIARYYEDAFIKDEEALHIIPPHHRPRATDYIPEQITLTQILIEKGFAYEANGSVYFRTTKFKTYGQLSGNNLDNLISGARVEVNTEKENPLDFALWKNADPTHLMQWESPWGQGFPGWHLECSAMSQKLLGDHFDIHTGGEDNAFPHHECEIAQNECSCGHKSVNYWLHTKHLLVGGEKMSKSKGNFYTIKDLLQEGWTGAEIRYSLLNAHYRSTLNFTKDGLTVARNSIKRINEVYSILSSIVVSAQAENQFSSFSKNYQESFQEALFDDLNIPEALSCVFGLLNDAMSKHESNDLTSADAQSILTFLETDFQRIFSVLPKEEAVPAEIQYLLAARIIARETKEWSESDRLRDEIKYLGYEVLDGKDGQRVKKI